MYIDHRYYKAYGLYVIVSLIFYRCTTHVQALMQALMKISTVLDDDRAGLPHHCSSFVAVSWAFSTVGDWMMNPLSTLHSLYCYCQQFTDLYMHRNNHLQGHEA